MEDDKRAAFEQLGRYVYEFSWLCWDFKHALTGVPGLVGSAWETLQLVTGEMTAQPLANACFAVCEKKENHDPAAVALIRALRNQVVDEIQWRNSVVHGDWMIGWSSSTGVEGANGTVEQVERQLPPTLTRVLPGRSGADKRETREIEVEDLAASADRLRDLRHTVEDFVHLVEGSGFAVPSLEPVRLTDVYCLKGKRNKTLAREGPRASEVNPFHVH